MTKAMGRATILKTYFQREDDISPKGGRKVEVKELMALTPEDRDELAALAAPLLGVTVEKRKI